MKALVNDLLSTIVFVGLYWLSGSIYVATGVAVAAGVIHIAAFRAIGRKIDPMQWLALGLVVAFGATTLLTNNPKFILAKPSLVHFIVAAVMLKRGWMGRYLPPIVRENLSAGVIAGWGYGWAALMLALGVANLIVVFSFDARVWAWFIAFGAIGAKFLLAAVQYVTFRALVRRQLLLAPQLGSAGA